MLGFFTEVICKYVERHEFFGSQQIEEYEKAVRQPMLSDLKVVEEMLADAFVDMKTVPRIVEKMSEENPSVAQKFLAFTKKLVEGVNENVIKLTKGKALDSLGYKLLKSNDVKYSPYKFLPKKQKKFDEEMERQIAGKYSEERLSK